jgi:hypothetical protein
MLQNGATLFEEKKPKLGCKMRSAICFALVVSVLVAGCTGTSRKVNAVKFDGHYFAGRASKVQADPVGFTVRIRNAAKSISGAREAARYEATIYCIEQFGTSDIIWSIGPDDEASLSNRSLTLAGRCDPK